MFERFKRSIQPVINIYHLFKAIVGNAFYGFPSKKLKVIGVTGTDGKTTTTHLIYHILKALGKKVSMVSSIYAKIGGEEFSTGLHVTTPDALIVQKLLRSSVDHGDEFFVLETTSHALDQNRIWGVSFSVGAITNITNEHLDYHKTYDKYLKAKAKILLASDTPIINRDDNSYESLKKILAQRGKRFKTYGLKNKADFQFDFQKEIPETPNFNNYNYLAAFSSLVSLGIPKDQIIRHTKTFTLPLGRLEVVYDKELKVIVDFAHTSNSIYSVLSDIKRRKRGLTERLIHVFGSAGLRDFKKRALMGEASGSFADLVILTEEDFRTEDPDKISEEIAVGLKKKGFRFIDPSQLNSQKNKVYTIILDRKSAIEKAIQIAKEGDTIITTGKSHEQSLARGKKEYPWDEKKAVLEALNKRAS